MFYYCVITLRQHEQPSYYQTADEQEHVQPHRLISSPANESINNKHTYRINNRKPFSPFFFLIELSIKPGSMTGEDADGPTTAFTLTRESGSAPGIRIWVQSCVGTGCYACFGAFPRPMFGWKLGLILHPEQQQPSWSEQPPTAARR